MSSGPYNYIIMIILTSTKIKATLNLSDSGQGAEIKENEMEIIRYPK